MFMNNNLADEKVFPQVSVGENAGNITMQTMSEIYEFAIKPAVQNRPVRVIKKEEEAGGLLLTLGTEGRTDMLSFTHETSMYYNKPAEKSVDEVFLHINLWSNEIFRVVFSKDKEISNPFEGLPENTRMLIAKPEDVKYTVSETDDRIDIKTDRIIISVDKNTTKVSAKFVDGREFFSQKKNTFFTADIKDLALCEKNGKYACFEAFELEPDEVIYGLGERFDGIVRNGRTVDFHNKDAVGTTSRRTYVNIPFYLSTKGYGLFLNSGAKIEWEIGTKEMGTAQFGVLDSQLDYFVIAGETPKDIIKGYCFLTGFATLPPLWSFGLWMSRNSYVSWDVVDEVAEKIRENDIPCDVLHLDTAWFNRDWNCDLKFSEERFPNPGEYIKKYEKDGFKISLWQYNFIPPNEDNTHYHEAVKNGYLSKDKDGNPYQLPEEQRGSWGTDVTVDFSNPEAREWYKEKIAGLIKLGVGAIKTDFGEGISEEAVYMNIDGKHFHNLYSLVYNSTVFDATASVTEQPFVWARSGTAGSQRYPLHWGGDSQCTFDALACTLRAALSIGMSGIPFFSHDIGGFIGLPTDELYVRWAQVGLFSSHSRCHGAGDDTYREPWRFSKEAFEIFKFYDKLRYSMMPYIYEEAEKCTKTGLPMVRALYLEYPEDINVRHIEDQYMFGDGMLIAPVLKPLSKTNLRNIYLPEGVWFDYFTKEKIVSSGMWIKREVDLKTLPIYIKEGTVIKYCSAKSSLKDGIGEIIKTETWI